MSSELLSMATSVRTTVVPAVIDWGSAQRTDSLIVPTSRVTRVTRSPEPADSTRESGSRRIARTISSRAAASRPCPSSVEVTWAANVISPCRTTIPATTSAMEFAAASAASCRPAATSATVESTRAPSRRGMSRPAPAARTLPRMTAMVRRRRAARRDPTNRKTLRRSAMGSPVVELIVSATNSRARRSRSR